MAVGFRSHHRSRVDLVIWHHTVKHRERVRACVCMRARVCVCACACVLACVRACLVVSVCVGVYVYAHECSVGRHS